MKGSKKMIVQKVICDIPFAGGKLFFGRNVCGEPAMAVGGRVLEVMLGKEGHHVCSKHMDLPLLQIVRLLCGDDVVGLADDTQR